MPKLFSGERRVCLFVCLFFIKSCWGNWTPTGKAGSTAAASSAVLERSLPGCPPPALCGPLKPPQPHQVRRQGTQHPCRDPLVPGAAPVLPRTTAGAPGPFTALGLQPSAHPYPCPSRRVPPSPGCRSAWARAPPSGQLTASCCLCYHPSVCPTRRHTAAGQAPFIHLCLPHCLVPTTST